MIITAVDPSRIHRQKKKMTRIVAGRIQSQSAKATIINSGKGAIYSSAYTGFKHAARVYGFYRDIKPYLPETYIDKYRYKPHKRVAAQILKTKGFLKANNKFHKKPSFFRNWNFGYCSDSQFGKGSQFSSKYCR